MRKDTAQKNLNLLYQISLNFLEALVVQYFSMELPLDWNSPCRGEEVSTKKFLPKCVNEKSSTKRRS